METRYIGRSVRRNEDARLLKGQGLFVDDVSLPNMVHAAFVRSNEAHGAITAIDVEEARAMPGVLAVLTAADLGEYWRPGPLLVPPPPVEGHIFHPRTQVPLARDKVRHVGEPVAVVVAESRYLAEDAAATVMVDIDSLPAVVDIETALAADAPLIHGDLSSNLAAHVTQQKGDYAGARARADMVLSRRLECDRGASCPMENRGIVAHWDARAEMLEIWDTTQAPIPIRNGLSAMLGLSESQVRVVAPFIGGGFGPKIMMFYPEEVVIPWLSMKLGRPVKWIEDREEHFFATTHERGQVHYAEIALGKDGRILGVRDEFLHDTGAYDPYGLTVPLNSQCTLLGCYDIANYHSEFKAVFTNKTIVTPYRGAGRPHGVFVIERLLDIAARELGIDRVEIRKRNLIAPEKFPYNNEIIYQDFAPLVYDSGNYLPALERACKAIDYDNFVQREQPRLRAEGKWVGIGVVTYVEGTGIGPYEGARVRVEASGKVSVATGVGTQGQGHFTVFAQVVAEQLGVDVANVRVVTGDTGVFDWGAGTFASRGAVVAGNACHAAALEVRQRILRLASQELEVAEEDLELVDGRVAIKGVPGSGMDLGALALKANPLRGAVQPGTLPGLEATSYFGPKSGATSNGVHAAIVEVDPGTFDVRILRYVAVHDCGTVINPLILEGQMEGGIAQGIGGAFYEKLHYDDSGQLLNASFMDYLLPTVNEMPPAVELGHVETPSPLNPLGIKGAGEAGTIPVAALFAQAVEDALASAGGERTIEVLEVPLSPDAVFSLCTGDSDDAAAGGGTR